MKKMINILLTIVVLMCLSILPVFAEGSEDFKRAENGIINGTFEDVFKDYSISEKEELKSIIDEYESNAEEFTMDKISKMTSEELEKYQLLPIDNSSNMCLSGIPVDPSYTLTVPYYPQTTGYTCGPAATLQSLAASGFYNDIAGSTAEAKENTLANEMYTTTSGTWINYILPVMDDYTQRDRDWKILRVTNYDTHKAAMQYFARTNYENDYAVTYLLETEHLEYYDGHNIQHYVTGSGIYYDTLNVTDYDNIRIRITDPHYNSDFGGANKIEDFNNVHAGCRAYSLKVGPASFLY